MIFMQDQKRRAHAAITAGEILGDVLGIAILIFVIMVVW
jgi:hypothetical protein